MQFSQLRKLRDLDIDLDLGSGRSHTDGQTGRWQIDGRAIACSEREREFTFAKNSSEDEAANVNFLRRHCTCRGQQLRPLNRLPNYY